MDTPLERRWVLTTQFASSLISCYSVVIIEQKREAIPGIQLLATTAGSHTIRATSGINTLHSVQLQSEERQPSSRNAASSSLLSPTVVQ